MKPWGEPASPIEICSLRDLDEFQSTKLEIVAAEHGTNSRRKRRSASPRSSSSPPAKRIKLEAGPLHEAIPQPHLFIGSSDNIHALIPDSDKFSKTFRRTPTPIGSHNPTSISALFASKYARVSWIVPVRGAPPWPGATRADFAHTDMVSPVSAAEEQRGRLVWTRAALRSFWDTLIDALMRAPPALGFITLSFHPVDDPSPASSQPGTIVGDSLAAENRHWLRFMDHVGVQCDAWRAPVVRTLLGTCKPFVFRADDGTETAVRVLAGAQLILVDHLRREVLLY